MKSLTTFIKPIHSTNELHPPYPPFLASQVVFRKIRPLVTYSSRGGSTGFSHSGSGAFMNPAAINNSGINQVGNLGGGEFGNTGQKAETYSIRQDLIATVLDEPIFCRFVVRV
jgi:hypothetical protein